VEDAVFKGRHFDKSVILLCVRWYLAYNLSLRNLEEMMAEAVLHGSVGGRTEPTPSLCLSDPDGFRASKLKHAVQGMNGDGDLRRATSVRS
jgi:hypothetical protein